MPCAVINEDSNNTKKKILIAPVRRYAGNLKEGGTKDKRLSAFIHKELLTFAAKNHYSPVMGAS
jgi:hypothetical protein